MKKIYHWQYQLKKGRITLLTLDKIELGESHISTKERHDITAPVHWDYIRILNLYALNTYKYIKQILIEL